MADKNHHVLEIGNFADLMGKVFVGEQLGLASCEASMNRMPAGQAVPFVHSHRQNQELYII